VTGNARPEPKDEVCLCELCDQRLTRAPDADAIPHAGWQLGNGVRSLFEMCAPRLVADAPTLATEHEIQDLLRLVERRSSMTNVKLGDAAGAGLILGLVLSVGVAFGLIYLADVGAAIAWCSSLAAGALLGVVIGAVTGAIYDGRKYARLRIMEAYVKYGLDPEKLTATAKSFSFRIRLAVQQLFGAIESLAEQRKSALEPRGN
jgi:hypothetical protein